jgi:hypothetical protein
MFDFTQTPSSGAWLKAWPVFVLVALAAGCASAPSGTNVNSILRDEPGNAPPPSVDVTRNQAWRDAEAVAGLEPDRLTVIGAGDSMLPVYGENTVLVLQKVAYRNDHGAVVLHRLVAKDARGWRAIGLNNSKEDSTRVTPYNLLGIVYAAFANEAVR